MNAAAIILRIGALDRRRAMGVLSRADIAASAAEIARDLARLPAVERAAVNAFLADQQVAALFEDAAVVAASLASGVEA